MIIPVYKIGSDPFDRAINESSAEAILTVFGPTILNIHTMLHPNMGVKVEDVVDRERILLFMGKAGIEEKEITVTTSECSRKTMTSSLLALIAAETLLCLNNPVMPFYDIQAALLCKVFDILNSEDSLYLCGYEDNFHRFVHSKNFEQVEINHDNLAKEDPALCKLLEQIRWVMSENKEKWSLCDNGKDMDFIKMAYDWTSHHKLREYFQVIWNLETDEYRLYNPPSATDLAGLLNTDPLYKINISVIANKFANRVEKEEEKANHKMPLFAKRYLLVEAAKYVDSYYKAAIAEIHRQYPLSETMIHYENDDEYSGLDIDVDEYYNDATSFAEEMINAYNLRGYLKTPREILFGKREFQELATYIDNIYSSEDSLYVISCAGFDNFL